MGGGRGQGAAGPVNHRPANSKTRYSAGEVRAAYRSVLQIVRVINAEEERMTAPPGPRHPGKVQGQVAICSDALARLLPADRGMAAPGGGAARRAGGTARPTKCQRKHLIIKQTRTVNK